MNDQTTIVPTLTKVETQAAFQALNNLTYAKFSGLALRTINVDIPPVIGSITVHKSSKGKYYVTSSEVKNAEGKDQFCYAGSQALFEDLTNPDNDNRVDIPRKGVLVSKQPVLVDGEPYTEEQLKAAYGHFATYQQIVDDYIKDCEEENSRLYFLSIID